MISINEYNFIEKNVPIVTTDMLIFKNDKILLCKRNNEPLKHVYYTPGGRVFKNENAGDAIKRKIKEELNIKIKEVKKPYGFLEEFFNYSGKERHNINILFYCELPDDAEINLLMNEEHSDIKWFNIKDKNIHSYIQMKIQKYLNNKDIKYNCVI